MTEPAKPTESQILRAAANDKATGESTDAPDLSEDLEEHKLRYEVETLKQQVVEARDTHNLRVGYSKKLFWLVCTWLACVAVAVGLSGFGAWGFKLSDAVLIAFITTTTVNVVGLFIVVAKWLFPAKNGQQPN